MNIQSKQEFFPTTEATKENLRKLRLYHWKEYKATNKKYQWHILRMSHATGTSGMEYHEGVAQGFKEAATFHILAVQTLNDFFPIGDTAEQDETKENEIAQSNEAT